MLHRKPHVVVFYGGSSGNEDLSTETGQWVCEYIPRSKYQVTPVEVTQDGKWKVPLGSLPTSGAVARVMQMLSKAVSPLVPAKALERLFTRPVDAFVSLLRGKALLQAKKHLISMCANISCRTLLLFLIVNSISKERLFQIF